MCVFVGGRGGQMGKGGRPPDGKGERGGGVRVVRCVCESKSVYVHVWVGG